MVKLVRWAIFAALVGAAVGMWITRAVPVSEDRLAGLTGDVALGKTVFTAAGCASCHIAPGHDEPVPGGDGPVLSGGQKFASDFGTFLAPNISPHPQAGIGAWTLAQFASAVLSGVSPEGAHYYPAFPYASYNKMTAQDVVHLWAYMQSLPASDVASLPHEVGFPFNIRRSIGGWKWLYMSEDWHTPATGDQMERGRYLVEALAHCAECHTPRTALGGLDTARWMAGAPNPSGRGNIPALTPDKLEWSATDIAYYLETGFTPEFDSAGGHMAAVVSNFSLLPAEDRDAVAAYVKALTAP